MFQKILIANRGEIAVRIIRACRELEVGCVAVYSQADAAARHLRLADESVLIGPPPPAESYLRGDRIIEAALQTGCQAIHPGYGFLAENADFAGAVAAAGLTFIGPSAKTIRLMGTKTSARAVMQAAGVPLVPGYQDSNADENLLQAADAAGYPLLVKAVAGGGGRGMRVAQTATDLPDALQSARREALNAFGDDRIYLEKYIADPRHIEFQIFADAHGNIVQMFERECSIQRRHQKIIEETPSPFLDEALRQKMGEAAVIAAKAAGYVNAGTVEFLVDAGRNFYFLEMNTRLQVEHPVTELVTGIDLVKLQIRVAAGEPLPFRQAELSQRGHAIECRIYAEAPANNFLPSTGTLLHFAPPDGPGLRLDSGFTAGDAVTLHYDPLLAKLVVLGQHRQEATRKMAQALWQFVVLGVTTNIEFLREVITHKHFQQGKTTTGFIDRHFATSSPAAQAHPPDEILIAAALSDYFEQGSADTNRNFPLAPDSDAFSPWQQLRDFRIGGTGAPERNQQ